MIEISVVVPMYNRMEVAKLSIDGLKRQTLDRSMYEIVLVDDCSKNVDSDYIAKCRHECKTFRYIRHEKNMGLAAARNTGVEHSRGTYVLFLDADIVPEPNVLEAHLNKHKNAKSEIALVSDVRYPGKYYHGSNFSRFVCSRELGSRPASERRNIDYEKLPGRYFAGGATSVLLKTVIEVGGFEGKFKTYGGEDVEFGGRVVKRGVRLCYCGDAVVWHHDDVSLARYKSKLIECALGQYKALVDHLSDGMENSPMLLLGRISFMKDGFLLTAKKIAVKLVFRRPLVEMVEWLIVKFDRFPVFYCPVLYKIACFGWMITSISRPAREKSTVWE